MNTIRQQGFEWYEQLPRGVVCRTSRPALSNRAASVFVHTLPTKTDVIVDCSSNPVVSMALGSNGSVERAVAGQWEKVALDKFNLTLTPAEAECDWTWSGSPIEIVDVHIPIDLMQQISQESFRGNAARVNLQPKLALRDEGISLLIRSMICDGRHAAYDVMLAETMTISLICRLLSLDREVISTDVVRRSTLSRNCIRRIKDHIEANISGDISLAALADIANMSRFHFLRTFRETVGVTPHVYVTEIRLDLAAKTLVSSDLSISEIASSCGFGDSSYFSARFKRRFKLTPMAYRRS